MACITPEGKLTRAAVDIMRSLTAGPSSPEDVSARISLPLFRVRSALRELADADYVELEGFHDYKLTLAGKAKLENPS